MRELGKTMFHFGNEIALPTLTMKGSNVANGTSTFAPKLPNLAATDVANGREPDNSATFSLLR
jgi:hypothetical protein